MGRRSIWAGSKRRPDKEWGGAGMAFGVDFVVDLNRMGLWANIDVGIARAGLTFLPSRRIRGRGFRAMRSPGLHLLTIPQT